MKSYFLPLAFLFVGCFYNFIAPDAFDLLNQAEKYISEEKYQKALQQIIQAEDKNECTCGNCIFEIKSKANLLRYHVYDHTQQFDLARAHLDAVYDVSPKGDSLEIGTYQAEFGKKWLSEQIDSALLKAEIACDESFYYVTLPLLNPTRVIRLKVKLVEHTVAVPNKVTLLENWRVQFKESAA